MITVVQTYIREYMTVHTRRRALLPPVSRQRETITTQNSRIEQSSQIPHQPTCINSPVRLCLRAPSVVFATPCRDSFLLRLLSAASPSRLSRFSSASRYSTRFKQVGRSLTMTTKSPTLSPFYQASCDNALQLLYVCLHPSALRTPHNRCSRTASRYLAISIAKQKRSIEPPMRQ